MLVPESAELEAWRAMAEATDAADLVARLTRALVSRTPAVALLVRALRLAPDRLEPVLAVPLAGTSAGLGRQVVGGGATTRLAELARTGSVAALDGSARSDWLRDLVPDDVEAGLVAVLARDGECVGVAILVAGRGQSLGSTDVALLGALRGPLASVLSRSFALPAPQRQALRRAPGPGREAPPIIGASTGLRDVMERVRLVAATDAPVLILGETGSGKEVIARAVHAGSSRHDGPVLRVNCGAIPPDLVDSELFGHERGSFTGAIHDRKGWFARADGGTLFLDEVAELSLGAQVRLLRILQDGTYEKVGGRRSEVVDVRIVAATHRDLAALVADGRFREDLYYRINVFPISLPSLRERPVDIVPLAEHFAAKASRRLGTPALAVEPDDAALLLAYDWPGNVRELGAIIERAAILGGGKRLDIRRSMEASRADARPRKPPASTPAAAEADALGSLDAATTRHLEAALEKTRGRIEGAGGAAAILGINPHTLRARMRKLGLDWKRFRA